MKLTMRFSLMIAVVAVALAQNVGAFSIGPSKNLADKNVVSSRPSSLIQPISKKSKPNASPLFQTVSSSSRLAAASADDGSSSSGDSIDVLTLGKYVGAVGVQMTAITALFTGLDWLVAKAQLTSIPSPVNFIVFYFLALKSRTFNPLSNRRPQPKTKEVDGATTQRKMPTWTPPGVVFPIVWLLCIGPLRAATSTMIYNTVGGQYANKAILSLMLHLSIGDVWNTINNVEQRYGTSVLGVFFVWMSAAFAAFQYSQVLPLAGKLLSLKLIWLTIASSLIFRTWQINPNPETGKPFPILPRK